LKPSFENFRIEQDRLKKLETSDWSDVEAQRQIEKEIRNKIIKTNFETAKE